MNQIQRGKGLLSAADLLEVPPPHSSLPRYPEGSFTKEAPRIAGIVCEIAGMDPSIEYHCNPGQILPHFYVKNIFLAQILAELEHIYWQPGMRKGRTRGHCPRKFLGIAEILWL